MVTKTGCQELEEQTAMNIGSCQETSIEISLPVSLLGALEAIAANQVISSEEACKRLIWGLGAGLADADLRSLPEPPRELKNRILIVRLDWRSLDRLSEASRASGLTVSSIFRRLLQGILITRTIHFVAGKNEIGMRLQIANVHVEVAEDFDGDGPCPLLSRQHRERI